MSGSEDIVGQPFDILAELNEAKATIDRLTTENLLEYERGVGDGIRMEQAHVDTENEQLNVRITRLVETNARLSEQVEKQGKVMRQAHGRLLNDGRAYHGLAEVDEAREILRAALNSLE